MPPKGHAILSASSSDRWLHCPPSARLCDSYDDKGSDYAAEGTDAHALCEYKLRRALGMEATDPTENLTWFNEEMSDCATGYGAYVLEQVETAKQTCADPVVLIEQRVDFSRWVESGFGKVRALCVRAISLIPEKCPEQLTIFDDPVKREKQDKLEGAIEDIRRRFGKRAVYNACLMGDIKVHEIGAQNVTMPGMMYA